MVEFLNTLQPFTRLAHIGLGLLGLFVFWIPIITLKGGKRHRFFGKLFEKLAWALLALAAFGVVTGTMRFYTNGNGFHDIPAEFSLGLILGNLTITAACMLYQGRVALRAKSNSARIKTPLFVSTHLVLLSSSILLLLLAGLMRPPNFVILIVVSFLGLAVVGDAYSFARKAEPSRQSWIIAHLNGMMGTGAAFYVAFGVFGSKVFLGTNSRTSDVFDILSWILPIIIFIPLIKFWQNKAMKDYGKAETKLDRGT